MDKTQETTILTTLTLLRERRDKWKAKAEVLEKEVKAQRERIKYLERQLVSINELLARHVINSPTDTTLRCGE